MRWDVIIEGNTIKRLMIGNFPGGEVGGLLLTLYIGIPCISIGWDSSSGVCGLKLHIGKAACGICAAQEIHGCDARAQAIGRRERHRSILPPAGSVLRRRRAVKNGERDFMIARLQVARPCGPIPHR